MKVLITGATGLIGKEIGKSLVRSGHQVYALSRSAEKAKLQLPFPAKVIEGDLSKGALAPALLADIEAVVHLAGENVGDGRWSKERKEKILSSREGFTQNLVQSLPSQLKIFLSASATGIYGNRGDEILTEKSTPGEGFLAEVCKRWEAAVLEGAQRFPECRTVIFRTGVVFSPFGGALMKMLPPFQVGAGGVLGKGSQWMSWIHLQDLVSMYLKALEDPQWYGIYNAVAPEPVQNRDFTQSLCQALKVRKGPPVPSLALKALYGEMAEVILDSQRVESERLRDFEFHFPHVQKALQDCASLYQDGGQVFFSEQYLPLTKEKVFSFFAKAENLEAITPSTLSFQLLRSSTPAIEKGTMIDYKLKIHGVPVTWQTLIAEWNPPLSFVDTQLKGPYKKWHHTHSFEDLGSGTLMRDVVRYQLPVGKIGNLFGGSFVRSDVENIFAYRQKVVPELLAQS